MAELGRQAVYALVVTFVIDRVAYSLCYRRHFLRLAESLDVLVSACRISLGLPRLLQRMVFRCSYERACAVFVGLVITRSERHLLFIGGFWGIGLITVAQTALA